MTEEIKEILNNDIPIFVIDSDGYTIDITETIHNVITNLQQKNKRLNNLVDSTTQLYLKELSEKGKVDDLACKMFNALEGNK